MSHSSDYISIFRDGRTNISAEQITQVWISLINQLERSKATLAAK